MKKIFFLLMAVILCTSSAYAERTISGTVVSELDNEPLIGATVLPLPLGGANGTATDNEGNFTLTIPNTCHEIRVSFVGLITREVKVTTDKKMLIKLSSQENRLDEVMVVAYGTAKRSEYTGSASVVKADQLQDVLVSSVTSALSGRVSGVQVQSSDGRPGGSPKLRIRGVGSINASAEPLYVVDGVPYDGAISDLANSDIESMTVLKDAASTALYGARGANGVVLITTKRGSSGSARVTFDARWGQNQRAIPNYNVLKSTGQYYELIYEGLYNQNISAGQSAYNAWRNAANSTLTATGYQVYTLPQGEYLVGRNGKINPNAKLGYSDGQYFYTPDDWTDYTINNGLRQEYNLSVAGGTDKLKYYVSGTYLGDDGIIVGSDFNRFSTRATVDYQAKTWLKIGTNMAYIYTNSNRPGDMDTDADSSSGNAFFIANEIAPVYPMFVRDADGNIMYDNTYGRPIYDYGDAKSTNFARNFMNIANPIGSLLYDTNQYLSDVFDGKWYATLTPCEGLNITGNAGYWLSVDRFHMVGNPFYGQNLDSNGAAEQAFTRSRSINLQALASYTRTFADKHNMDLMVGYETYNLEAENLYGVGYNLYEPNGWNVTNTIDKKVTNGDRDIQYTTRGILARAKYNFDNRYFFHASYRRDSSSRFAPGHRWGDFFSVSGAWDIAREKFMDDATAVDHLKLKVSFGQNGNDNLGSAAAYYYAWQDQYQHTGADGVWNDATLYFKGNREITWETSNALNAGVDFSFFNGRLDGTIEYYQRQVSDMLFNLPVGPALGYSSYPANVGSMRNYGVEIELNYDIFNTPDYSWSINANLTTMGNKVIKLPTEIAPDGTWITNSRIFKEGESMYNMYLVKYAGVDPETGLAQYWAKTADGQEVKTDNYAYAYEGGTDKQTGIEYKGNRQATGNIMPKAYGGFGTSLYLWGVDLSVTFSYQFGGKIYDNTYQRLMHSAATRDLGQNWHVDMLNRWQKPGDVTDVPRLCGTDSYSAAKSDRFLVSSDYLSLNNITLGYTLPSKYTRQIGIESIRIYGAAENVALWSKRRGLDPRQSYVSSINATYSPIRCVSGGIRVEF